MLAPGMAAAALAAAALFAGTNADDIVVLTMLNMSSRAGGRPRGWHIWAGQYAGFTILVAASLGAAAGLTLVPARWLWLLGLVPLGLGLHKLAATIRARRSGQSVPPAVVSGLTGVMGLTIVNGGANISVYTPLFRTSSVARTILIIPELRAGTALYFLAGSPFAAHHAVTQALPRSGQRIGPALFILM